MGAMEIDDWKVGGGCGGENDGKLRSTEGEERAQENDALNARERQGVRAFVKCHRDSEVRWWSRPPQERIYLWTSFCLGIDSFMDRGSTKY